MRPIRLKISGLNSYIETQTIDFEKLTERGLFGIFGPTGCGKSTILDAMILSLYGHKGQKGIPRSTNEFINTAVDQASIGFLFGLDTEDGPRNIHVERKFKRTDTGLSTNFSRLQVLTESGEVIDVWDKTTDVTNQVIEILGLTREDFMRSVVLPQGRFSEFLTLEGKERRDMLERLLNLKAYGSTLQRKIKERGDMLKYRMLQLEGEMKRFSDITPEVLNELKDTYEKAKKEESELKQTFKMLEQEKESLNRLYKVIESLRAYQEKEKVLNNQLDEKNSEKHHLELASVAERLWPFYMQFERANKQSDLLNDDLKLLEIKFETIKVKFEEKRDSFNKFDAVYGQKKELLSIKLASIEKVKEHQDKANTLKVERAQRIGEYKSYQQQHKGHELELENLLKQRQERSVQIQNLEKEKESNFIPNELREQMIHGVKIEEEINKLKESQAGIEVVIKETEKELTSKQQVYQEHVHTSKALHEKVKVSESHIKVLKDKIQTFPTQLSTIEIDMNTYRMQLKNESDKLQEKNTIEHKVENLTKEYNKILETEILAKLDLENAQKQLDTAEKHRMQYWRETVLTNLAESLGDEQACPLCGSEDHPSPHVHQSRVENKTESVEEVNWAEVEQLWRLSKLEYDKLVAQKEHNYSILNEETSKLKTYETFSETSIHKTKLKLKSIEDKKIKLDLEYKSTVKELEEETLTYETRTVESDKKLELLKSEERAIFKLETQLDSDQKQCIVLTNEIRGAADAIKTVVSGDIQIQGSFKEAYKNIRNQDVKYKAIEEKLEIAHKTEELDQKNLDILSGEKHKAQLLMEKTIEKGSGLKDRIDGHEAEVKAVVGDENIEDLYSRVKDDLKTLNDRHVTLKDEKITTENELTKVTSELEGLKGQISQVVSLEKTAQEKLHHLYEINEIKSSEMLLKFHMEESNLKSRQTSLKQYFEEKALLEDRISELEKERDHRSLTTDVWQAFLDKHAKLKIELDHATENRTTLSERLKSLEKDSVLFEKLTLQYKKFEQIQDLIADLMDLVRGNKFVEYVAITHLKYIALDASKRLMDITNHRYSLELDAKGNFIICDHYNGGVKRDTKTLSGGETFLTALSLSLALSSQIQLKGRTNLEFFFLDEGFGTLDNELLDIVMTSLEKLFHEKLTVGIISHVDELKNRVPIKLTVEAAQAGVHGTKTKIEVT